MLAAAALAALSCLKEYSEEDVAEQICESDFVAITPAETKTSLDGINIHWTKGDQISIFEGTTINHKYQVADNADGKSYASLNRIADDGFAAGASISANLAYYPYSTETNLDVSDDGNAFTISTTLPSTQAYAENSFGNGVYPMVAMTSSTADKDLCFQNICGNIKLQLKGTAKITSIVITGNNNEVLCGAADMTISSNAVPSLEMKGDGKSVTLDCGDGVQLDEDTVTSFVIVLPPVTFTNGFIATVSADDNTSMEISTSKEISITRSTTSKMAAKTYQGKHANIIDFADQVAKYACVEKFDTDGDGEISYAEAAAVTDVTDLFTDWNTVKSFDEFQYFTSVTAIPNRLFDGCTALESVKIPTGVKTIGSYAFSGCSVLNEIELPEIVTSIGTYAFFQCSKLTSININCCIIAIAEGTFQACTSLNKIVIPPGVTTIEQYAFCDCTALEDVFMPTSIETIGQRAFAYCSSLTDIVLPSSLHYIGVQAFSHSGLTSVVIPETVTALSMYVFEACTALKNISLPSTLTSIGYSAFSRTGLTSVVIPDSVTSLECNAFQHCYSLTSAVLPSGLTSIPNNTFYGCTSLLTVSFPTNLTTICNYAFYGCSFVNPDTHVSKIELPTTITNIYDDNFNAVGNVIVPSSSTVSITSNSFSQGVKIYVPDSKVEMYKAKSGWSNFSDYIFPLSEYSDTEGIATFEAVDLGLSVKWASCNVGASVPEDYGGYYAWGETFIKSGYGWSNYLHCQGSYSTITKYCSGSGYGIVDNLSILDTSDDVASKVSNGSWRMPTIDEWQELKNAENCLWTPSTKNGVDGYIVSSKKEGYSDKSIFLPAAGYSNCYNIGVNGYYWSSSATANDARYARSIRLGGDYVFDEGRYLGYSIRPVQDY